MYQTSITKFFIYFIKTNFIIKKTWICRLQIYSSQYTNNQPQELFMKRNTEYNSIKIFSESVYGNISGPDSLKVWKTSFQILPSKMCFNNKDGQNLSTGRPLEERMCLRYHGYKERALLVGSWTGP